MISENLDHNASYTFHLYPFLQIPDDMNSEHIREKLMKSLHQDITFDHLVHRLKKPLWCGETGHPLHLSEAYPVFNEFLSILEENNVGWTLWPFKDTGAMAMTYAKKDGKWNHLCGQLSENWMFWNIFSQDSILSVQNENDPYAYYQWLANESTKAWQTVLSNLSECPFDRLLEALEDFSFENCRINEKLLHCFNSS